MNNLTIIGNLVRDPDSKTLSSEKNVTQFTIAVDQRNKDKTDFFRVSAWGKLGEICLTYLKKGAKVAVSGNVTASAYLGKDGTAKASLEVNANEVEFLSPKTADAPAKAAPKFVAVDDPDLPF